jgi:hypothetical protein
MLLKCLAQVQFPHRAYHIATSANGKRIVACSEGGRGSVLNSKLQVTTSFDLGRKVGGIAVRPRGDLLGLSAADAVALLTTDGEVIHEARHPKWSAYAHGGCRFSPDGRRLWATRPADRTGEPQLQIIDCSKWRVLACEPLPLDEECGYQLAFHREGEVAMVWAGAGQDGQWLIYTRYAGKRLDIYWQPCLLNTGPPAFHPSGAEFLAIDEEQDLCRYRFADGKVLGRLDPARVFPLDNALEPSDLFGVYYDYVSDHRALVHSNEGRLYLVDLRKKRLVDDVLLEGHPLELIRTKCGVGKRRVVTVETFCGDVCYFHTLSPGRIVTVHETNKQYRLKLWDASPFWEEMAGPGPDRPHTAALVAKGKRV